MEEKLVKRALLLEYLTVIWNILEAFFALLSGAMAGSIALVGFGFDSIIELMSGVVLIWRFRKFGFGPYEETRAEKRALIVVGVSFCLLALYILQEAFGMILFGERPEKSIIGIVLAILSIILMPILGILKFRLSVKLGSRALRADSMETFICAYLSLNLLAGLFLNALSGLWWADPVAALLMLPFVIKEGISALREGKEGFI